MFWHEKSWTLSEIIQGSILSNSTFPPMGFTQISDFLRCSPTFERLWWESKNGFSTLEALH